MEKYLFQFYGLGLKLLSKIIFYNEITGIEHIGIASDDLSKANKFWNLVLGINKTCTEDIEIRA